MADFDAGAATSITTSPDEPQNPDDGSVWHHITEPGESNWSYSKGSSTSILLNGTLHVFGSDTSDYAFNADDGSIVYQTTNDNTDYASGEPVAKDATAGELFLASSDGLIAVNAADGSTIWTQDDGGNLEPNVQMAVSDNYVVVGDYGDYQTTNTLYCLNRSDGTINWTTTQPGRSGSCVVLDGSSNVIAASDDAEVASYDLATGSANWTKTIADRPSKGVVDSGVLFFAVGTDLQARNVSDGTIKWSATLGSAPTGNLAHDGTRLFIREMFSSDIFAYDPADGSLLWQSTVSDSPRLGLEYGPDSVATTSETDNGWTVDIVDKTDGSYLSGFQGNDSINSALWYDGSDLLFPVNTDGGSTHSLYAGLTKNTTKVRYNGAWL